MKKGFFFTMGQKDVFVITDAKRKTEKLLKQICRKLLIPDNAAALDALNYYLRPATLQQKTTGTGRAYNEISGENFSGYGHFLDENRDIIIEL